MDHEEKLRLAAADGRRAPRGWLPFATGLSVGLATGLVGVGLVIAWERSRREQRERAQNALDEELAQTYPASDPLPHSHRVD